LTRSELVAVVSLLVAQKKVGAVKLTGGEPLLRADIVELVAALTEVPGIEEVSATTNATALPHLARRLARAGLARVNISIDTLDPDWFHTLTGGTLTHTLAGIDAALEAGLVPVKLNTVLLASRWRRDLPALLDLASGKGVEIRFIELMRTGTDSAWVRDELVAAPVVRSWLSRRTVLQEEELSPEGPARRSRLYWRGSWLTLGWITPRSQPFCGHCHRLRLDAAGNLRRCLVDPVVLPLDRMRRQLGAVELRNTLDAYLQGKTPPATIASGLPMALVGG